MAFYCFTQPIQPVKQEAEVIFEKIQQSRRSEDDASRRRLGLRKQKVWFQSLAQGDTAVVYME